MADHENRDRSLGELVSSATKDLSLLLRQEVALAKVEITRELTAAARGAGLFGAAGVVGMSAFLLLAMAAAFGASEALDLPAGVGFLLVGGALLLLAGVLGLTGRRTVARVGPPERTIETLKDDVAWAKHPTHAG